MAAASTAYWESIVKKLVLDAKVKPIQANELLAEFRALNPKLDYVYGTYRDNILPYVKERIS